MCDLKHICIYSVGPERWKACLLLSCWPGPLAQALSLHKGTCIDQNGQRYSAHLLIGPLGPHFQQATCSPDSI